MFVITMIFIIFEFVYVMIIILENIVKTNYVQRVFVFLNMIFILIKVAFIVLEAEYTWKMENVYAKKNILEMIVL